VTDRHSFMAHAACRTIEHAAVLFFPDGNKVAVAQAICAACPVAEACLDYALDERIEHGVWGGVTAASRRRIAEHRPPPTTRVECPACFRRFELPAGQTRRYCTPTCATAADRRRQRAAYDLAEFPDPMNGDYQTPKGPTMSDRYPQRREVIVQCRGCSVTTIGLVVDDDKIEHDLGRHLERCPGPLVALGFKAEHVA
jgi:WhiB family transcriptional regulator, redox-sensing transcriptional regulator